ncbi:MAG: hypothetical protein IPN03_21075 [Holophagales bacterium]|nr:hypothetical protein [Holophagales bacterium]
MHERLTMRLFQRLAFLSDFVYRKDFKTSSPPGYEIVDSVNDEASGLQAAAYRHAGTGNIFVMFRGTDPSERPDVAADFDLFRGQVGMPAGGAFHSQLERARAFTDGVMEQVGLAPIKIGGHSLGGAIAQVEAARTGLEAHTFNAPGVSGIVEKLYPGRPSENVFNHVESGDPVSTVLGSHHGLVWPHANALEPGEYGVSLRPTEMLADVVLQGQHLGQNHSMTRFAAALMAEGGQGGGAGAPEPGDGLTGQSASEAAHEAQQHAQAAAQHETEAQQHAQQSAQHETEAQRAGDQALAHEMQAERASDQTHGHETEAQRGAEQAHAHESEAQRAAEQGLSHEEEAQRASEQSHGHEAEAARASDQSREHEREAQHAAEQGHTHEAEAQRASEQSQAHESDAARASQQSHEHEGEAQRASGQADAHESEASRASGQAHTRN